MDTYRLGIIVEKDKAQQNVTQINDIFKNLEAQVKASGKTMTQFIKTMDDKQFEQLYLNVDELQAKFKGTKNEIDGSVVSMRYLARGLHGFRMDMLNILFLGMSLSATFGAMRIGTAMGGVFEDLKGVFAELTVGKSLILAGMVSAITGLISFAADNPGVAQVLGDVAVALGLIGGTMVLLATLTMTAGSMFGTEGLPETLRVMDEWLNKVVPNLDKIKQFAVAGLAIGVTFFLVDRLWEGEVDILSFLALFGLSKLFEKNPKFAKYKAVTTLGISMVFIGGLFSESGEQFSTIDALSSAFFAGQLASLALGNNKRYKNVPGMIGVGIFSVQAVLNLEDFAVQVGELFTTLTDKLNEMWKKVYDNPLANWFFKTFVFQMPSMNELNSTLSRAAEVKQISGSYNSTNTNNYYSSTNNNSSNPFINQRWS